ncbi:MAG: hypothetical protein OHK0053_34550 [Microscillaceae bacterium]
MVLSACQEDNGPETPQFAGPQDRGLVANALITEASGLVVSRSNASLLWTHNDSGDPARLFLLTNTGEDRGTYTLENAQNQDWEDLALAARQGVNYLHIADIGDNASSRPEIQVYRLAEPDVSQVSTPQSQTIAAGQIEKIRLQYPDGPRDAETLLVNANGDIYIISKEAGQAGLYRAAYPQSLTNLNTLEKIGSLSLGEVVGGDAGNGILLKTYTQIFYWPPPATNAADFGSRILQTTPFEVNYVPEPQGEALAWLPGETGYFTLSEELLGTPARLYFYGQL